MSGFRPIPLNASILVLMLSLPAALLRAQDSTSALINQALDQPVKLDFTNTALPDAMGTIANQTGVRIEADPAVWDLLPWGQQTSINRAKFENVTLREALTAIARKLGLVFVLHDEIVELRPMPALQRLGRRATIQELNALDLLSATPIDLKIDRPTVRQLLDAVDQKLMDLKSAFAIEFRAGDIVRGDQVISVPRNATMAEAMESLARQTNATWYPWGKSIVVVSQEDQIRNQLAKTITTRYRAVDVGQVLMELFQRAGVPYEVEPGAIQRIPPETRSITLQLDNASIREALETIAGATGLSYTVTPRGVYVSNPSRSGSPGGRDPIIGLVTLPDLGIQVLVPQSQVSPELREYIRHKTRKELEKIQQMMKEENFQPSTQPAEPTTMPENEDL